MKTHIVNIGLAVTGRAQLNTVLDAVMTLNRAGIVVMDYRVAESNTEPTFVARVAYLTPLAIEATAALLNQEAIAVLDESTNLGELYGPGAEKWKPFNPAFFLSL